MGWKGGQVSALSAVVGCRKSMMALASTNNYRLRKCTSHLIGVLFLALHTVFGLGRHL